MTSCGGTNATAAIMRRRNANINVVNLYAWISWQSIAQGNFMGAIVWGDCPGGIVLIPSERYVPIIGKVRLGYSFWLNFYSPFCERG